MNCKARVYWFSDHFVNEVKAQIENDKDLSEIPFVQKRLLAKPLNYYAQHYQNRDEAIFAAFESGGYSIKEIGEYFELHFVGRVSRKARDKTCSA